MEHPFHYRQYLKGQLKQRMGKNPSYSSRAFARDLGLSSSQLSKILAGRQEITDITLPVISGKLFASEAHRALFADLVRENNCSASGAPTRREEMLYGKLLGTEGRQVDESQIKYFYTSSMFCVFEIFSLKNAPQSPAAIGKKLGISADEAEKSLAHLVRLGLLKVEGGIYRKTSRRFKTTNNISSQTIRELHKQFIGKALRAIDNQPLERRYLRGSTVSIRADLVPQMRDLVERFLNDVSKLECESEGEADSLYQVNVQLFDLLEEKKDEDVA